MSEWVEFIIRLGVQPAIIFGVGWMFYRKGVPLVERLTARHIQFVDAVEETNKTQAEVLDKMQDALDRHAIASERSATLLELLNGRMQEQNGQLATVCRHATENKESK